MDSLRLDHVVVVVWDIRQATEDYERLLGIEGTRTQHPDKGFVSTLFHIGDPYSAIELCQPTDTTCQAGGAMRRRLEESGEGIHNIALAVNDVNAAAKGAEERGVEPLQSEHSQSFFLHPREAHGALIQILERP